MNSTLLGIIEESKKHSEINGIFGSMNGAEGILKEDFVDLKAQSPDFYCKLKYTPASIIGTSRGILWSEDYKKMIENLKKYDIKYVIYSGGNGSMSTCYKLFQAVKNKRIRVIGIPETIDNDVEETDHSLGYGSAARYMAITTAEIAQDIAAMPIHVSIIEAMGRNTGWIAASSILARKNPDDGPHLIYVPERPFVLQQFLEDVKKLYDQLGGVVVVVSEGLLDQNGKPVAPPMVIPGRKDIYYGDLSVYLARQIWHKLGIKARSEKPGIAGRASILLQSPIDRDEAIRMGAFAVNAAVEGKTGYMVGFKRILNNSYKCDTTLIPLEKVAGIEKRLPDHFINNQGNYINQGFIEYCKPLVGKLPDYAKLEEIKIKKSV